jgi:pimeloyl-ACP methyl ester carboxylesterase
MSISKARNGDIEIAYERLGSPEATPLLLIPGSGSQMVMWPDELCAALVERGFQVVRMDNRDSGLSTWLRQYDGRRGRAYTLQEMAGDVIAVVDAIGAERAHLMGGSLGAMIAQATAIHYPQRVSGLVLGSAPCGAKLRLARPKIRTIIKMMKIMRGESPDAAAEGQRWVDLMRLVGSPAYPVDEAHWRAAGALSYERGLYPAGSMRHTRAQLAYRDMRPKLATLAIPTLVVQGKDDPMMSWRAAKITADAIPGARFQLYPGVGHDLPREIWPEVLDLIAATAHRPAGETSPT